MSEVRVCRILVVEDEVLVAMDMEILLERAGYAVAGPVCNVDDALALVQHGQLDAAVLDVNLGRQKAFPIADALADAGVPFIWLTGHSPEIIPQAHRGRPLIGKPFVQQALIEALRGALERSPGASIPCDH